jgi:hypothetical protein
MNRFLGKLGFIHRRLWSQDGLYRAALLFGPAPLVGCLLAGAVWGCILALGGETSQPPRWAVPQDPGTWSTSASQPQTIQPAKPLPPVGADGRLTGYELGWRVTTNPIVVSQTMDVDVKPTPLTAFFLDGPSVDMAQILPEAPNVSLYIGVGQGFLAIRTAGVYTLALRFERPAGPRADCLMRLGFGPRRIVSTLEAGVVRDLSITFDAVRFDLQPGLYPIGWAFGCWQNHEMIGPGRITLLVGHPGEQSISPARSDDFVR